MRTIPTDELKAVEKHIGANMHWFDEVDPVAEAPKPVLKDDGSEVFAIGPDQSISLPDSRVTITGPGFVDVGRMDAGGGETWWRLYFVQGVNQRGRQVAYDLSGT